MWNYLTDVLPAFLLQVGDEGAGHFVKMVHNGIEYGDMQLICEAYHLMKDVLGMDHDAMAQVSRVLTLTCLSFPAEKRCRLTTCFCAVGETIRLLTAGTGQSWTLSWSRSRPTYSNTGIRMVRTCCPRSATAQGKKAQGSGRLFQLWSTAHLLLWLVRGRKIRFRFPSPVCFQ